MEVEGQATKKTSGESWWNAWLPADIRDEEIRARGEHEAWFAHVVAGFARSMAAGHIGHSGRRWVRAVQTHVFDLNRPVGSDEMRAYFLQLLYNAITNTPDLDPTLQTKWASVLTRLFKKWKDLAGSVLTLPWRPLYNVLVATHFRSLRQPVHSAAAVQTYQIHTLVALVKKATRFFPGEAAQEIMEELRPQFCPHDNSSLFKAQALLCLFLPSSACTNDLIDSIFDKWSWIDRSGTWDANWLILLSRFAKAAHARGQEHDWTPYLPQLFTHVLRILDVSTAGASKLPKPGHHSAPKEIQVFVHHEKEQKSSSMAKLITFILTPSRQDQLSPELQLLRQLFRSIESYYYPSNSGGWSDRLALFLRDIAHYYAERVGIERDKTRSSFVQRRLTDADHKAFIGILEEPMKQAIYGKGSVQSAASEAIRHLSYIEPDLIFPNLLKRIYSALESLTATHQTLNAISTLVAICHPLLSRDNYPAGVHHLPQLLRLTLPGIDPNDRSKTLSTYGFYIALFSNVSLFDGEAAAESSGKRRKQKKNDPDPEAAAKEATAALTEWSPELLDRLFAILRNQDKPGQEHTDQNLRRFIQRLAELFFQQASPSLYASLSKKLQSFISFNVIPNATKEFGYLISAASLANPEAALKAYLPLLYKKMIKTSKDSGEATLEDRSDEELLWYLHLLASLVKKTGPAVIPHISQLRTVIEQCFATNKKSVAKSTGKLLKNILHALCQYYPTDYRSVAPSVWNTEDFAQNHWRLWGKQGDRKSPTIVWHQPTAEEINLASKLVSSFLAGALNTLQRYSSDSSALSKDELWVTLQQLRSIIRGAAPIIPQEAGQQPEREQWDVEFAERECPSAVTYPQHLKQVIDNENGQIRGTIGQALIEASKHFRSEKADDIKSIAQLIRTMTLLMNYNGISQDKLSWRTAAYKGSKQRFAKRLEKIEHKDTDAMEIEQEAEKPEKRHYRRILIDRAYVQYLRRVNQTNWRNEAGEVGRQLMRIMYDFSTSGSIYSEVRKKAQRTLHNTWRYRPFARHIFLPDIISKLSDRTASEDDLKGNAFLLIHRGLIRLIAREWRYLAPFMISISSSHIHSNEKLQMLLYQLFVLFSVSSYPLPLRSLPTRSMPPGAPAEIASAIQPSQEALRGAQKDIEFHTRKNTESYEIVLRDLLAIAEDSTLHWRYQVITSACLLFLLRPDPLPPTQVVRLFLRGSINELQPMRIVSRKALSLVLKIYKPAFLRKPSPSFAGYRRATAETLVPLTGAEWTSTEFVDHNWEGWNKDVYRSESAEVSHECEPAEAVRNVCVELANFFDEAQLRDKFLHYLAQDHHVRADETEEKMKERSFENMAKQFSSMLGGSLGKFVQSALGGGLGQVGKALMAQAATEVLREVLKEHKRWPYVVNKVPSSNQSSFVMENAQLFKGLFQLSLADSSGALARAFDSYFKPLLEAFIHGERESNISIRLHAGDQERNHALASEIMAGALRCLKYGDANYYEREWAFWIPFMKEAIASAPMDCVRTWLLALRFAIYNLDVRRIVPLGNLLVQQLRDISTEAKKEGDSLHDAKILQFVQPFLAETSWRATAFNLQVLRLLPPRIASPFKQVREELGHLLTIIFRNLWQNPTITAAMDFISSEMTSESFFASISEDVYKMKTAEAAEPQQDAMEEEGRTSPVEDISHARETLLSTLSYAVRKAAAIPVSSHIHHFIRVLFASLADPDRDTVNVAKQCAALAAQVILPERRERFAFVQLLLDLPRPDTLWHIRAALLPFLQIFLFNHRFLLAEDEAKQVRELVISMLTDSRVEVQELASGSLSSLLHGEEEASIDALARRFLDALGKPITRRTLKGAPEEKVRHGAALGLAAIVQSVAYTVPSWLPPLLVQLAPYEEDAHSSVKDTMKKAFAEFKRTHQEAWELHQEAFTEEQLAIVSALGKTPTSYYL